MCLGSFPANGNHSSSGAEWREPGQLFPLFVANIDSDEKLPAYFAVR